MIFFLNSNYPSLLECKAAKKLVNMSSAALLLEEGGTPNRRRVSFCDSVQIEEIEPNLNKSLFRSTPKPPSRAKLVLSSYFNSKQQVSSPTPSSSVNAILADSPAPNTAAQQRCVINAFVFKSLTKYIAEDFYFAQLHCRLQSKLAYPG